MAYKITNKTTKDEAARLLGANIQNVAEAGDKNLLDRMVYTSQHLADAKRKDLVDLLRDVMKVVGDKFIELPTTADEAKAKTTSQESKSESEAKSETKKDTPKTEAETKADNKPKPENLVKAAKNSGNNAAAKKLTGKVTKKSKGSVKSQGGTEKTAIMAVQFPVAITVSGETFKIDHSIKTLADLRSDENADVEFEFAFFWAKRHLKQFPYFSGMGQPKSFPNDLDTAQLIYVSENDVVAYAISDSTEALYTIYPGDLEEVDGLRYCSGIEFQIYRKVDSETEEVEDESDEDEDEDESEE